jgi:hypothetical protein
VMRPSKALMPVATKKITNHGRNWRRRRTPLQPAGEHRAFDGETEVGQCDVRLQQGHGASVRAAAQLRHA